MKRILFLIPLLLVACGYGPAPAPQVIYQTVVVQPTTPPYVPPTAKPYVAPVMTEYEWAQATLPSMEIILAEMDTLMAYSDAMSADPFNSRYESLFAASFDVIHGECRRMGRLNPPASVAVAHNEMQAACADFNESGNQIARYFIAFDIAPIEEAVIWMGRANDHIDNAADAMPN